MKQLHPPPNRKLVLVAEDDDALRGAIMALVRQLGLRTLGAADGRQMLAVVEPLLTLEDQARRCPDLILTDLKMPGIEAIEIVEGIAAVGRPTPIVVVSGMTDARTRDRVASLGIPWVDKPLHVERLEAAVLQVLPDTYDRIIA